MSNMAGDDVEASSGEDSESDVAIDSDESGELPSPSDLDTAFIEPQEQEGQESTSVESVVDDSGISMDMSESEQSLNRSIESLKEAEQEKKLATWAVQVSVNEKKRRRING